MKLNYPDERLLDAFFTNQVERYYTLRFYLSYLERTLGSVNQNCMHGKTIQEFLFQKIKEILLPGQLLPDVIAGLLHVSHDSAYRRIRGETLLVLEETKILCQHFNISIDQLLNLSNNSVVFQNIELENESVDFKAYLKGILKNIKQLDFFEERKIIYLTKDIPIFQQFCFKAVNAFRYFFWMKTIFQHPDFIQRKFSPDCMPEEIEGLCKEILTHYCKIPSIEIWNKECINSTLIQISYYLETGTISQEDAAGVYDGIRQMLEHLHTQTEYGRKFLPGENPVSKKDNFQLFYNRIGLSDTTILATHNQTKTVYLNYDVLNYIATTDESFCNQVQHKLETIMRRSTLISSVSEKQRNIFFNILYAKLPMPKTKKAKSAL